MGCPDENLLGDFLDGLLSEDELESVQAHLEGCETCRRLVAGMAQVAPARPKSTPTSLRTETHAPLETDKAGAPPLLSRGTSLSRYVLLDPIGAGGMGVVYAAFDPELDRKVAIKLLRSDAAADEKSGGHERMLREAKLLARLSHANVVAIHDVGRHEGGVFIAMDYVQGSTLTEWLRARPRSWREVVDVFLAAGLGLEAAHAASLVHRDFKPDNVLVSSTGEVRVTDFGLAHPMGPDENAPAEGAAKAPAGTLPYMAPEQLRREAPSARSDQFSFCVALYEGLWGRRPFQGATRKELIESLLSGRTPEPPGDIRVSARVRRAVLRGLSPRPEDRFPSMNGLLLELGRARRGVARRRMVLASVAAALLLAAGGGYLGMHRAQARVCTGAERKLAGVWDEEQKGRIRGAFLASEKPFAQAAFDGVARALEPYASALVRMQTEACEATRIYGEQTEEQLALRTACLEQRLQELGALTSLLATADAQMVQKAPEAARSLDALDRCADLTALASNVRPPEDAATRARIEGLRKRLAEATALYRTGRYARGLEVAESTVPELDAIGYAPAQAQGYVLVGRLQHVMWRYKEAERSLFRAVWAADAGRDDELRAYAWITLIQVLGVESARPEDGRAAVEHATAALQRLGRDRAPRLEASLHVHLGVLYQHEGGYVRAAAEYQEALAIQERVFGPDAPEVAVTASSLGLMMLVQYRLSEALALFERAITITQRMLGPDHPKLAHQLTNRGFVRIYLGNIAGARADLLEALAIYARTLGKDHPYNTSPLQHLAYLLRASQAEEALMHARHAVKLIEAAYGPDHPDTATIRGTEASVLAAMERVDEAIAIDRAALATLEKAHPQGHPNTLETLADLSLWEGSTGRLAAARGHLARAQEIGKKLGTIKLDTKAQLARALGELELRSGRADQALPHYQEAMKDQERAGPALPEMASALAGAADALIQLGRSQEALPLLRRASEMPADSVLPATRARLRSLERRASAAPPASGGHP